MHTGTLELVGEDEGDGTVLLSQVKGTSIRRIKTGRAWDKNFGGQKRDTEVIGLGIAIGSTILIGGVAGAGKSTGALQLSDIIAKQTKREVMYVAAEESEEMIKDRASRLRFEAAELVRIFPMGCKTDLAASLVRRRPVAIILDSLPGLVESPEEGVTLCSRLKLIAVELDAPILIIDHINKQDDFAGLEKLKHCVDTTITLFNTGEGEYREMTTEKNRFGMANVVTTMLMTEQGLIDVDDEEEEEEDEEITDDRCSCAGSINNECPIHGRMKE